MKTEQEIREVADVYSRQIQHHAAHNCWDAHVAGVIHMALSWVLGDDDASFVELTAVCHEDNVKLECHEHN
jgi:hypothetical protein